MIAVFYLVLQILKLYSYVVLANVVISWLVAFNILNTQNRLVYSILEVTYRLTNPVLNKIRGFLPNLGSIDMYVRCFTKTDDWEEWLSVKEKLAIEIKKIVEKNKASFAFPSQSIYVEKK